MSILHDINALIERKQLIFMVFIYKKLRTILFPSLKTRDKIAEKMADKMAEKTYKKNKIKETADPNLNDLEINDNSTIDKVISVTRIDCNNCNLENNGEFNIPLEILVKLITK